VIEALKAKNIPAEAFTLNAYAAVQVLKAGIEKAGSPDDATAVATAIKSGDAIDTVIGKLTYGESGDLTSPSFSLYKWEGGQSVAVE
jgi:branched-chain amino acid transport system substrate-binding protein